jgi:hypothetical protein
VSAWVAQWNWAGVLVSAREWAWWATTIAVGVALGGTVAFTAGAVVWRIVI